MLRGDLAMTGVVGLFAPANNFSGGYGPIPSELQCFCQTGWCSSRIGETVRMLLGVTLLQREVLEAEAGGASTVTGGGRRLHYLDGAQRAVK